MKFRAIGLIGAVLAGVAILSTNTRSSLAADEPKLFLKGGGRDGYFYDQYVSKIERFSASTSRVAVETRTNRGEVKRDDYYVMCGDPDAYWTNTVKTPWSDQVTKIDPKVWSSATRTQFNLYWAVCRGVYQKT